MENNPRKWAAMAGVGLGVFMATLDASIVNISLPTLVEELNTNLATIEWVVLSYSLVLTALMLTVGRLGDMRDKKKIYLAGMALFTLGSILCGSAPTVHWLIGFRAVQGLGAVMMQAIGIAIITEVFPSSERGRALGIMGTIVSTGIAIGPAIGGILIGLIGWRSIFFVNIPIGIFAWLVVLRAVPQSLPTNRNQRFDFPGALVLLLVLACYALGMTIGQASAFKNDLAFGLLAAALVGLALLLWVESRSPFPMIDLSLFRNKLFSINLLMGFLVFVVMAANFIVPFFLQLVKHYPTQQVGLMMMSMPLTMGLVAPLAGMLSDRFGSRLISIIGLLVIVGGCLAMSTLHADVGVGGFILRMIPFGLGMGLFQSPNNSAIMGSVPRHRLGIASGLLSLARTMGHSTGLPLGGVVFSSLVIVAAGLPALADVTAAPPSALVYGLNATYRLAAGVVFLSTLLAVLALYMDRHAAKELPEQQIPTRQ